MSFFSSISLVDQYGFGVENSPMGEQRVCEVIRLCGSTFNNGTLDYNFYVTEQSGLGPTISVATGVCTVASGTGGTSSAVLQSVRRGRYSGGSTNRYRAQIVADGATQSNNRGWGCYDANDGAYFELTGLTMSVCYRSDGVDTKIGYTSWNTSTTIPTVTNVNTYEIYFTNKSIYYVINDVLVHKVTMTTTPWSSTKNFPTRVHSTNISGSTSYSVKIWVATICRLGPAETDAIYAYVAGASTNILKLSAGKLHSIINNDNVGSIIVYDGTSAAGRIIASIDFLKVLGALDFNVGFSDGLTIVSTGSVKYTVVYE